MSNYVSTREQVSGTAEETDLHGRIVLHLVNRLELETCGATGTLCGKMFYRDEECTLCAATRGNGTTICLMCILEAERMLDHETDPVKRDMIRRLLGKCGC